MSRTRCNNMATLKPATPLLASNKGPLKPASPLRPKTAAKTPISHPQRRLRFQSHTDTSEQRRLRFQTTGPPDRQSLAGRRADAPSHTPARQAPLVWRAPEGPEGVGRLGWPGCGARGRWRGLAGLRDDAPSQRLAAWTARGRAAAHRHTQRPGPPAPGRPVGPQATRQHTAKGPKRRSASGPSRVSVAHRLSWMLRPGTASISSRV